MSEEQTVTYELDGEIALVGLNRPDKRNCFNPTVMKQLREAIERAGEEVPDGNFQLFGQESCQDVGGSPRRKADVHAHGFCRVVGLCGRGQRNGSDGESGKGDCANADHDISSDNFMAGRMNRGL